MARENRNDEREDEDPEQSAEPIGRSTPFEGLRNFVRNSPWVAISIALHVVVIGVLALAYVGSKPEKRVDTQVLMSVATPDDEEEPPPPEEPEIERKPLPENEDVEVVPFEESFIPAEDQTEAVQDAGDPTAIANASGFTGGTSMGVGVGGHFGTGRPSAFAGRLGAGRKGTGLGGRTQATDAAVLDGQRWLLRHQNADGSWTTRGCADKCLPGGACVTISDDRGERFDEGLTGLALLCFLGSGYSHESKQRISDPVTGKTYKVGEQVKKGLLWLKERQQPDGQFTASSPWMYNEALATLAMAEAYGLTMHRAWRDPAQKAIDFLVNAQRPSPREPGKKWGWRYYSRTFIEERRADYTSESDFLKNLHDADTSVTGWVIMALKSAELSGLDLPEDTRQGAVDFAKWVAAPNGLSGYLDPGQAGQKLTGPNDHFLYHSPSMAAVNMCIRIFMAHDREDPYLVDAADQLIKDPPRISDDELSIDYYYWYYATLALNQLDGPDSPKKTNRHWNAWNKAMNDSILKLQDHTEKNCSHGGWMTRDRWSHEGGRIYSTAINVLTLQVYYRYGNAFGTATREHKAVRDKDKKAEPK